MGCANWGRTAFFWTQAHRSCMCLFRGKCYFHPQILSSSVVNLLGFLSGVYLGHFFIIRIKDFTASFWAALCALDGSVFLRYFFGVKRVFEWVGFCRLAISVVNNTQIRDTMHTCFVHSRSTLKGELHKDLQVRLMTCHVWSFREMNVTVNNPHFARKILVIYPMLI